MPVESFIAGIILWYVAVYKPLLEPITHHW
jgi:hypothetical protein